MRSSRDRCPGGGLPGLAEHRPVSSGRVPWRRAAEQAKTGLAEQFRCDMLVTLNRSELSRTMHFACSASAHDPRRSTGRERAGAFPAGAFRPRSAGRGANSSGAGRFAARPPVPAAGSGQARRRLVRRRLIRRRGRWLPAGGRRLPAEVRRARRRAGAGPVRGTAARPGGRHPPEPAQSHQAQGRFLSDLAPFASSTGSSAAAVSLAQVP